MSDQYRYGVILFASVRSSDGKESYWYLLGLAVTYSPTS